jgi:hypothetical protein
MFERGLGIAKFGQAYPTLAKDRIGRLNHRLRIDETLETVGLDSHPDGIPLAGSIMSARDGLQDGPGENVGAFKTSQTQLAGGGIKAVMPVLSIRSEDQPGGAGFVVEFYLDFHFVGKCRHGPFRQAKRPAAKTFAHSLNADVTIFPRPSRAE